MQAPERCLEKQWRGQCARAVGGEPWSIYGVGEPGLPPGETERGDRDAGPASLGTHVCGEMPGVTEARHSPLPMISLLLTLENANRLPWGLAHHC